MPPPTSNDTGTALGQDVSDWSRDLATLTFDLGGHGACSGWCGLSSSIRMPNLKLVGLAIRKIWRTMCVSINGPGNLDLWPLTFWPWNWYASRIKGRNLTSKFGHARRLQWVFELFAMYAIDGRTDKSNAYCPLPCRRGHNNKTLSR